MGTVTPTIAQLSPNQGKKMHYFTIATCTAADTFSLSSVFSSIEMCAIWRTKATGSLIANTISGTTVTIGAGPSAETVYGLAVGEA